MTAAIKNLDFLLIPVCIVGLMDFTPLILMNLASKMKYFNVG
jgi:hypothetical protein